MSNAGRHRREPMPHPHWTLLGVLLLGLLALLAVFDYTSGALGENAHAPQPRQVPGQVPTAVRDGGPVVDPATPQKSGLRVPPGHVALTFDDGPSRWTSAILGVLDKHDVPATFFVVGAHVAEHPGLLRRMYASGDEVGVHTFSHTNLADVPPSQAFFEVDQTQLAVAAATGHTTNLLRPPYSSVPEAITPADWQAMRAFDGYRIVLTDRDTEDWRRPGVGDIVRAGLPADGRGAVIMLHDGGGNRSETVAALGALIRDLKSRGYTFDTVTSATRLPSSWQQASTRQQLRGWLTIGVVRAARLVGDVLPVLFTAIAVLSVLRLLLLLAVARRHSRRARLAPEPSEAPLPGVSIVVPAYNEEKGIVAAVKSLASSDYPLHEVIVVDDGSTDATADKVAALQLPCVRLIRQTNAGKPGALNAGIRAARHDILVLVDGDTVFERDALRALVAPFTDRAVGAVSGNPKVGNRRRLLGRWQHIEYVIGANLDRRFHDVFHCMPTVPGAIGAFRRTALMDVGGVPDDTLAEDTDLTMALCRAGWRVVYAAEARAWTEAPESLTQLWRQRFRWCYGTLQAVWKHRRAVLERGPSGKLGRRGLPYVVLFQLLLPLLAPALDLAAVYSILFTSSTVLGLGWLGFLLVQLLSGVYAFRLDDEPLTPLWSLPLQQLVYRQLMYLVILQSVANAGYGIRLRWQSVPRIGKFESAPSDVVGK